MLTFLLSWLALAVVLALILGRWLRHRLNNPPQSIRDEVDHGI
jgi:hypothetical protein